jgi:hypothetical protein
VRPWPRAPPVMSATLPLSRLMARFPWDEWGSELTAAERVRRERARLARAE